MYIYICELLLLSVYPRIHIFILGSWVNGKREGRGLETTDYWTYSGGFRNDMKHGAGEERTTLGTVFKGNWERGRKHGQGNRKIAYGLTEEQVHDELLPNISRLFIHVPTVAYILFLKSNLIVYSSSREARGRGCSGYIACCLIPFVSCIDMEKWSTN